MINNNAAGYSLLTLLVYSALLSGIAVLIMPYAIRIHMTIKHQQENTRLCIQRAIALDSLVYDIQTASALCTDWHMLASSQLIMRCHDYHVSWIIEKAKLIRIEGVYDITSKLWHTYTKSFITSGIDHLQIMLHKNNIMPEYVSAVTVHLADSSGIYHATRNVVLPNRVLL
jgi:hypothetical protein